MDDYGLGFAPSFFEHLEDRLNLAVYDTNQEFRAMRRRLIEPAFIDGQMRPAGYEFEDNSAGPHRRNDGGGFAYHPQFVDIPAMSVVDRIKSKAVTASGVVNRVVTKVEAGLDEIIGSEQPLMKHADESFAPHLAAISETKSTLDGVKGALDIMSNGGPALDPLPESAPVAPPSEAPKA